MTSRDLQRLSPLVLAQVYADLMQRRSSAVSAQFPRRRRKPMSIEAYRLRYAAIIALRESGETLRSIGRLHGVTAERVRQIARRAGIQSHRRRHRCVLACATIEAWLKAGGRAATVARRLGMPRGSVRNIMRRHGLTSPRRLHVCRVCPQIIELYASGMGTPEIGRRVGLAVTRVVALLQRHGVTLRPRGYFKGQPRPRYDRPVESLAGAKEKAE